MSIKPKIYAPCKAGCNWETVHKSDFEASASHIIQNIGEDGVCYLEQGKEYKIFAPKNSSGNFTCSLIFNYLKNNDKRTFTITHTNEDEYAESFVFRLLQVNVTRTTTSNIIKLVYELAGVRYSEAISGESFEPETENALYVKGATRVLLYNADATIVAKSAYQIAVENGFDGSEEEWLVSLKGEKGDTPALDTELNTSSQNALSNAKITEELYKRGLFGTVAPTTETVGVRGQIYTNTSNGKIYVCTSVYTNAQSITTYTWEEIPLPKYILTTLSGKNYTMNSRLTLDMGFSANRNCYITNENADTSLNLGEVLDENNKNIGAGFKAKFNEIITKIIFPPTGNLEYIAYISDLEKLSDATNLENGEGKQSTQIKCDTNVTKGRGANNLGRYGLLDTNYGFISGYLNRLRNRTGGESLNACGVASGHGNYGRGLHTYMFGQYQIANTFNCFMSGFSSLQNHTKKIYTDENVVQWSIEDIMENTSLTESDRAELLRKAWLDIYSKIPDGATSSDLFQCITTPDGAMETSLSAVSGSNNFCIGKNCDINGNNNYIGKNNHACTIDGRHCFIFDVEITESGVQNNHACINLIGDGLKTYGNIEGGMLIVGSFNKYDKEKDKAVKFQIGNGKSDTQRSNALTVYENGTVEIGDTTITETQLKALLALIN